jgi:peptide chain release factor subunit 1
MMIDRNQLEILANYQNTENPVISLYLNITPPRNPENELNSMIHNTLREIEQDNRYTDKQIKRLKKLMEQIEDYAASALKRIAGTRMVALFADADGFWQEYHLPVGLPSSMVVEVDPYTRPMTMLLDEFDRYCVVVADSRKARIFSLHLGDFEEFPDVFIEDNVPDGVRVKQSMTAGAGGTVKGGLGDKRIERHIEDHVHRHLKNVADKTLNFFKKKNFTRLILGGPDDKTLPNLKDHLHSYLKDRLAAEFNAHPDNPAAQLKEKAIGAAQAYERENERALLDEIIDRSGPNDKGELGVEPVLEALMLGQVQTLAIKEDFKTPGYVCPNDRTLSTYQRTCPVCGGDMHYTEYLADEMVEEALNQNAEVQHVFAEHETFDPHGIGARLRFIL